VKLAAAPISWGVCEVPDWGVQLPPDRVLREMAGLGFTATEAGPPGFLPADASIARRQLDERGLRLVGGFVTAVLHDPARRAAELAAVERQATWLAAGGAASTSTAAATGDAGYSAAAEIDDGAWGALFVGLDRVGDIAARAGLTLAVHPHFGTVIGRRHHIERFLAGCAHGLCLDTGHLALGGADPVAVAKDAGGRVKHVHLKDTDASLAARTRAGTLDYADAVRQGVYRPLGEGAARIADVLACLGASGYEGWYVLEQDVMLERAPAEGAPAHVARSLAFLRGHA